MTGKFDIANLVDDLVPVKALTHRRPLLFVAATTLAIVATMIGLRGMRADILAGHPDQMFLVRAGILLVLGCTTAHAVTSMASPSIGKSNNGWQIALAAAIVFPMSALIVATTSKTGLALSQMQSGMQCMLYSAVGGLATAVPMVAALRRGAPTSLARAGWLTGISAGGLGAFAYNLHCPFNNVVYTGFWYTLAVAGCAVIGRLAVPHLIRW